MPRVPLYNLGVGGIVKDTPDHLLPPEVWSDGKNIRFQDNKVKRLAGEKLVFDPPGVAPYWAFGAAAPSAYHVVYAGLAKLRSVQGGAHTDRTRTVGGDYTGTAADKWNGGVLGGIPVITNGVDTPQHWATIGTGTFEDLTNWPASTLCKLIRPFKAFLMSAHITKSGTVLPHRIKWSHPAVPGSVPPSWDETDETVDAGELDLPDSQSGTIQDMLQLRDLMVVYKERSSWGVQHIGGRFIMRTQPLFSEMGIMTQRCVALVPNAEQHFLMTGEELVVHNGQQVQPLLDKRWKRFLSNSIDTDNFANSFAVPHQIANEMWFCFPETGATTPNLALIWNYRDNTLTLRELNDARFIGAMVVDEAATGISWDADADAWDIDSEPWGATALTPLRLSLLQCDSANTKLLQLDSTTQFNGTDYLSFIERTGLAIIGRDRQGQPKADATQRKLLKRVWIRADGDPFQVRVGAQEEPQGPVTWGPLQTFNPGVDRYVDTDANGALLAVRFESAVAGSWEIESYDLDIELLGEH